MNRFDSKIIPRADCANGFDEHDCPPYVSPSFELPLYCYLVVLILAAIEAIEDLPFPEASYKIVHDRCGGLDLLIGAAFTFPLQPIARHKLAVAIQKEEENRNGDKWQTCIRRKAGSTKAAFVFLDSFNPTGCHKILTFGADEMLRWLSDSTAQEPDSWYKLIWNKTKAKAVFGFLPFLKTTSFVFDYVKDIFLFLYIFSKQAFIASKFIKGLINFHGLTILASGILMGFAIQFDNAVVNLESFAYPDFVLLSALSSLLPHP